MKSVLSLLLFSTLVFFCNTLAVPKCKLSDSDCLKSSANAFLPTLIGGIKEINSEPLDPMMVDKITVNLSGLNLVMNDVLITGLGEAKIEKLSVDLEKKQIRLLFLSNNLLKGKYKASGQLLILPISGDGDFIIDIKKSVTDILINFDIIKNSDGKDFMNLKSFTYNNEIKDGCKIRLTKLFNGNKQLSEALHKFMDDNWKLVSQEFGRPILDTTNKILFKVIKKYLKSQPLEVITLQ